MENTNLKSKETKLITEPLCSLKQKIFSFYITIFLDNDIGLHSTENDKGSCSHCEDLQLELDQLKKLISPDDDKIPEELWKLFPPKGQYLRNILVYSGYETYDSIVKLNENTEMNEVFSFVKNMSDIMDEKEKEEIFGIFSKYPGKVMVLPGLKSVVSKFVDSVAKLKASSTTMITASAKEKNNKTKRINEKRSHPSLAPPMEAIESLVKKLCAWIKSHKNFQTNFPILKGRMNAPNLLLESTFSLAPSTSPIGVIFACKVCKNTIVLQVKATGSIMLSNTHRHISMRC